MDVILGYAHGVGLIVNHGNMDVGVNRYMLQRRDREGNMRMITRSKYWEPTWANQLREATKLLNEQGPEALNNPHSMIGRTCGCMDCFCCAAATVYKAYTDNYSAVV